MTSGRNLGAIVTARFGQAAVIRTYGGEPTVFFVSNGSPAVFQEFELHTGKLLFRHAIEESDCCWAICVSDEGLVYFSAAGDGSLFRYDPVSRLVEKVGHNPSDDWVWQLGYREGRVYGGTYPGCSMFAYDEETGQFRDYGTVMPGQQYVRGFAVSEEWLYAGIGSSKGVVRIHRETGEREELALADVSGRSGFVDRLWVAGGQLFVSCDFAQVHVYRLPTLEKLGAFVSDGMLSEPADADGDYLYFKAGGKLRRWRLSACRVEDTGIDSLPEGRVKTMTWLHPEGAVERAGERVDGRTGERADEQASVSDTAQTSSVGAERGEAEGLQLALVTVYGEVALIGLTGKQVASYRLPIEEQPIEIQSLETGPDGLLYIGGYHRGLAIYHPDENRVVKLIETFPQTEAIGFCMGQVYMGTYTKAKMYRYDPVHPVDFGMHKGANPEWIGDIGHNQDRPFTLASGDGKLFAGTIPDYGQRGGALAEFHPLARTWKIYPDVVEDHSIIGLAYKDGLLFGGTSLWGGLGSEPADGPAKLFIWDVAKGRKIAEFVPDIPELDMPPRMIGELSIGPEGNLWGVIDGTLFVMNPAACKLIKSKVIIPSAYRYSKWRPIFLRWGPDGLLYTTLGRKLIVVHPETLVFVELSDMIVGNMTLDRKGRIYVAQGAELVAIDPPEGIFGQLDDRIIRPVN
ncbi:hypothetical protein SAMN02799630_04533 [Paenibacillus sp. UNCCL117]|uniref:hypothetical protein n=1 Tax=unclassified Paenibacillus TaxID=185978 RepID=UPI00088F53B9|nr:MULTISPECIES: hypothetical protein [unclassified Paenibacillus]SDD65242.1 hypothetical protein SAMN04488602_111107 [Paenibacillus sp. cl123]SFW58161.1 hypothetical protein SAMN02799630_04533 [Paenibacillus sp. UNCCL117]